MSGIIATIDELSDSIDRYGIHDTCVRELIYELCEFAVGIRPRIKHQRRLRNMLDRLVEAGQASFGWNRIRETASLIDLLNMGSARRVFGDGENIQARIAEGCRIQRIWSNLTDEEVKVKVQRILVDLRKEVVKLAKSISTKSGDELGAEAAQSVQDKSSTRSATIRPELRTRPMSLCEAAGLMFGRALNRSPKWSAELLSKSIRDGSVCAEKVSARKYVFNKDDFPADIRAQLK